MYQKTIILALCAVSLAGCGSPPSSTPRGGDATINDMAMVEIGEMYRTHNVLKGAPPKSLQDVESMQAGYSLGYQAIQNGDIVMLAWGIPLPDLSEEPGVVPSNEVLAHQKQVPEEGGLVLLLDRRIVEMTPAEFQAAPKAGPSSGAAATK